MGDLPGTIARYEIRAELGRGMMGVVYRAHDPVLGRDVALKVIHPAVGGAGEGGLDFEQRFVQEARSAARLSHPGIVVVHDVGRDPATGSPYMALELLRGRTLDRLLREEGARPWAEALRLAQRLAEALQEAHLHGIVHRDVKPANVMVLESGEPKIMDFGIAKVEAGALTATGQFFGTPLYMSPEQAHGRPVDARSDIFSLGAVLYEMLTGRKAFAAESVPAILLEVTNRDPAPPTSLVEGLPPDVDYVVGRCLAKEPGKRYADGRALAEDLSDILNGVRLGVRRTPYLEAAQATRVSSRSLSPARSAERRSPVRMALLAGTLLIAGMAATYSARNVLSPSDAPPPPSPGADASSMPTPTASPEGLVQKTVDRIASVLSAPASAQLMIDFEHSLKSGTLRVWVDDDEVIEEQLDGRVTKDIGGLKLRKGRHSDSLALAPGRHVVRVQVDWEDGTRTESIRGNFEPGQTRRLQARMGSLGGLRRNLSLEWR
jgi:serine/threonine-protein kinase